MVLRSFWRQNQLHGTHSFQENTILVNRFGWYKIIMAKIQCVLSHYCTSFHETIYKGTNTCGPKLAFLTIAISFGALLMGWLVVVARGLYLARHLFTLLNSKLNPSSTLNNQNIARITNSAPSQYLLWRWRWMRDNPPKKICCGPSDFGKEGSQPHKHCD